MSWGVSFRISQYVKSSLWLLPLVGGVAGIFLAEVFNWLDGRTDLAILTYSPETATAVVSATIAAVVSQLRGLPRRGKPTPLLRGGQRPWRRHRGVRCRADPRVFVRGDLRDERLWLRTGDRATVRINDHWRSM